MAFLAPLTGWALFWEGFPQRKGPPEGKNEVFGGGHPGVSSFNVSCKSLSGGKREPDEDALQGLSAEQMGTEVSGCISKGR